MSKEARKPKKPFTPTKGGDGGSAPKIEIEFVDAISAHANKRANSKVCLTCVAPDDIEARTEPTEDPYDRAHRCMIGGMLIPAATVSAGRVVANEQLRSKPRRYTTCYMVWQQRGNKLVRVSFESKLDDFQAARFRLDGIPGIGAKKPPDPEENIYTRTEGDEAFRHIHNRLARYHDKLVKRESQDYRSHEEKEQDAITDEWLANHENGSRP